MNEKLYKILEFNKVINKLAGYTASDLGRELALKLVPFLQYNDVADAMKETDDAVSFISRRGSPPLAGTSDIRSSLKRLELGSTLSFAELLRVADVLRVSGRMKDYSAEADEDNINTISSLISSLYSNKRLEEKISFCIISEEEMADDASSELQSIRRQIRNTQGSIKDKLNDIVKSSANQKYMQDAVVTMRGDRYVIPVKVEYRQYVHGLVHDSSSSGQTLFIEPMAVVEANNKIKELKAKEQNEIERILKQLSGEVLEVKDGLHQDVHVLSRLDFAFAKASLSFEYKCVSPNINTEHKINIKNGRHPLLNKDSVVPINFWIGDEYNSLVVTGPNTGGKTVTLKTVGLFTLMTQAGLHIPASDGTSMSIYKEVFADIGDEQSIEQSLSTFSSHMKNIVGILDNASDDSLVLFDELGAGTDPTEGAALAMSILECLHQIGATTVATTHYSELKVFALSTAGFENACCEFDVETLRPTYKLLIGVPGKSNAFAISSKLGLDNAIIERAKEFLTDENLKFEDLLLDIERNRERTERDKAEAEKLRYEIECLKNEIDSERRKLDKERESFIRKAKSDAAAIVKRSKDEADGILSEIRALSMQQKEADLARQAEELRSRLKSKLTSAEDSLAHNPFTKKEAGDRSEDFELKKGIPVIKEGTIVHVTSLNNDCTVLRKPDKDGNVLIQAGLMKINVHYSNLEPVRTKINSNSDTKHSSKNISTKSRDFKPEIDLRGEMVDDAIFMLDKYLDDASLAGVKQVSVIHGKGTGALRAGVHSFLKGNRHVKSFRLGTLGEGDTGVTIVEVK